MTILLFLVYLIDVNTINSNIFNNYLFIHLQMTRVANLVI